MPRVVHFEIHADQPERAVKFYKELFDWQFHKWEGPMDYWLIVTGPDGQPGINGGLIAGGPAQRRLRHCLRLHDRRAQRGPVRRTGGGVRWPGCTAEDADSRRWLAGLLQRPGKQRLRPDAVRQAGAAAAVDPAGISARRTFRRDAAPAFDSCQRRRTAVGGRSEAAHSTRQCASNCSGVVT